MVSSHTRGERTAPPARYKSTAAIVLLGCALVSAQVRAETFTVNDAGDDGNGVCDVVECTLREAVAAAEDEVNHPGVDIIEVASGIDPVLTQANEITITTEVTIAGQGVDQTTISGNDNSRLFVISATGDVTVEDVTLTGGRAPDGGDGLPGASGGAIVNLGTLSITSSALSGNRAGDGGDGSDDGNGGDGGDGGAIVNSGALIVTGSTLSGNRAGHGGDPEFGDEGGLGGDGGAISNSGTLDIATSMLAGNEAGDGGDAFDRDPGPGGRGGAIFNSGQLGITVSVLTMNLAGDGGAGDDGFGGDGGAIFNSGNLDLTGSMLSANRAGDGGSGLDAGKGGDGGAVSSSGQLSVMASTLWDNRAGDGGNASLVDEVAVPLGGNAGDGGDGGAIDSAAALTLVNSTLFGNMAGLSGSAEAPALDGAAGAVHYSGSGVSVIDASTIAGNAARRSSGGIYMPDIDGSLVLTNTLVAENTVDGFPGNCFLVAPDDLVDDGGNLDDGTTCGFGPDSLSDTEAGLDPAGLRDNGGPTQTVALLPGSSAIDRADDDSCPEEDQRGVVRGIDAVGDGSDDDLDGGCDIGAFELGFVSTALVVDPEPLISDGNGVFEPGERVVVAPTWQNGATSPLVLAGTASDFTGPTGPMYQLVSEDAEYGEVGPAEIATCLATGICYQMEVDLVGVDRPATHWEATFEETLSGEIVKTWTLHLGDSFADVPRSNPFYSSIETLLHSGVTGGCSATEYCPGDVTSRAQMPIFLLKALEGPDYTPPACPIGGSGPFDDVPVDNPACPWVQELANRHVISGCGADLYCPSNPVTRAQMAVFLLKTLEGHGYTPPECSGAFVDVACPSVFSDWVEDLYERGITSGCSTEPLGYCPHLSVTRGQMSVFLSKTFSFTLYGP